MPYSRIRLDLSRCAKKLSPLILLIAVIFTALNASAETEKLSFGIKIWYPDHWQKVYEADKLIVRSPNGAALAMFTVFDVDNLSAAQQMMNAYMTKIFTNINMITQPTLVKINGMDSVIADGTGMINNVYTIWVGRLVIHNRKVLMVLGCIESLQFEANKDMIGKILQEIKK